MTKLFRRNKLVLSQLSVFFPAYNEEKNISATVLGALKILPQVADKFEILVINDGSTDTTAAVINQLGSTHPQVKLISHPGNLGYGAALKTGITSAKFSWICYTDSDGQFDFREIDKFIPSTQTADMIIGFRKNRTDNPIRRFLALMLRLWDTVLFGLNVKDVDCGFKLFKKQVINSIGPLVTSSAITETELLARTKRAGFTIVEVPVTHHARPEGIQTGAKLGVITKAFIESFKLFWYLK